MCDQDHFEEDRKLYEARGLVTRKQFGKILGAGMAMMLPSVANAAAVTEADVNITTPDLELGGLHVMRAILVDHARGS